MRIGKAEANTGILKTTATIIIHANAACMT